MIGKLALSLATSRDRMSRWRQLALVVASAASTVALLLIVGFHGAADRVETRLQQRSIVLAHEGEQPELFFLQAFDSHRGRQFEVRYVQPQQPDAPTPPGVERWPGPGDYIVSPALARAIDADPGLKARYRDVTVLGDAGITDRDEWLAYRRPPAGSAIDPSLGGIAVAGWGGLGESGDARTDLGSLLLPSAALLGLPATFLMWGAMRTAAVQRDRRLVVLHWLGLSRTAAAALAAIEGATLALPGAVVGALTWFTLGRSIAWLPITGFRPVPGDFGVTALEAVTAAGAVVIGAAIYSWFRGLRVPTSEVGTRPWAQPRLSRLALLPSAAGVALVAWQYLQPPGSVSFTLLITTPILLATGAALMAPFVVRSVASWLATERQSVVPLLAGRAIERDPAGFARPIIGLGVFAFLALVAVHLVFVESRYEEEAVPQDDQLQAAIVSIVADDADQASAAANAALPDLLVAPVDRETLAIAASCERLDAILEESSCASDGQLSAAASRRLDAMLGTTPDAPVRLVPDLGRGESTMAPGLVVIGPRDVDLNTLVANAVMPGFLTLQVLTIDDFTLRASGLWGWVEAGLVAGGLLTAVGLFITAVDRSIRDPMLTVLSRIGAAVRVRRRIYVARFVVVYAVVMSVLIAAGWANGLLILRASREPGFPAEGVGAVLVGAAIMPVLGGLGLLMSRDWSNEAD